MAENIQKTLRTLEEPGFTTKNSTLTYIEGDNNFIALQREVDLLSTAIATNTHTQQTDRYLQQGLSQEFDSQKFRRGHFNYSGGNYTITYSTGSDSQPPFTTADEYILDFWGWEATTESGTTMYNKVYGSYKNKTTAGVTIVMPVNCRVEWMAFV